MGRARTRGRRIALLAAGCLLAAVAEEAQARVEAIRWRQPGTAVPQGFLIHVGPRSHEYVEEIDVGSLMASTDGIYGTELEVPDAATVYVAVTAYNAMGSSTFSNEGVLRADGSDPDGDGVEAELDNCQLIANTSQCDTDHDGYGNACDGDFNNDGAVSMIDLASFRLDFGTGVDTGTGTDMNCNGTVRLIDYYLFRFQYSAGLPGPSGLACAGTVPCP